jgi:mannose-6-phosphate isomerase
LRVSEIRQSGLGLLISPFQLSEAHALTESADDNSQRISLVCPSLDAKPWGGQALRAFGFQIRDDQTIGEALITANDVIVIKGYGAGSTLGEIVALDPDRFLGARALEVVGGRALFPLLVKLIDANEDLSIQVHPNDEQAAPFDRLGKTEAWYVLQAEPGSKLYLGLTDPDALDQFVEAADRLDGSSALHLRAVEAKTGTTYLLPAGTVHALGAGVIVYEIQQPSDITYRLDDWGRVDASGQPREMHREQGLAVLRPEFQPNRIEPVAVSGQPQERHVLVANKFFALERWSWLGASKSELPVSTGPQVVTLLSGTLHAGPFNLAAGESAVVWPGDPKVALVGEDAVALRGWVPDASDTFSFETVKR